MFEYFFVGSEQPNLFLLSTECINHAGKCMKVTYVTLSKFAYHICVIILLPLLVCFCGTVWLPHVTVTGEEAKYGIEIKYS